jgi:hypothetical protein
MIQPTFNPLTSLGNSPGRTPVTVPWIYGNATRPVVFPEGITTLTDTIEVNNLYGIVFKGAGMYRSEIQWNGPTDRPVFRFRSCRGATVSDLSMRFLTGATAAIEVSTHPSPTATNTKFTAERLWIEGLNKVPVLINCDNTANGGSDNNGDFHTVRDCTLTTATDTAIYFGSSQAHMCTVDNCGISSCPIGVRGLATRWALTRNYGSSVGRVFQLRMWSSGCTDVIGNNFENCNQAIRVTERGRAIRIIGNRFDGMAAEPNTGVPNDDASVFIETCDGFVEFRGNGIRRGAGIGTTRVIMKNMTAGTEIVGNILQTDPSTGATVTFPSALSAAGVWRNNYYGTFVPYSTISEPSGS